MSNATTPIILSRVHAFLSAYRAYAPLRDAMQSTGQAMLDEMSRAWGEHPLPEDVFLDVQPREDGGFDVIEWPNGWPICRITEGGEVLYPDDAGAPAKADNLLPMRAREVTV